MPLNYLTFHSVSVQLSLITVQGNERPRYRYPYPCVDIKSIQCVVHYIPFLYSIVTSICIHNKIICIFDFTKKTNNFKERKII